jgi:energy-coupling factor transport system ATP-binding protein
MGTGLATQDLSFSYAGESVPVLRSLSARFPRGKLTLLLGPSGCGKSTLLLCANGLIPHSVEGMLEGAILLEGEDITARPPRELCTRVGLVFQDAETQFCTLTVEDEIAFGLENLRTPPVHIRARVDASLALVGMPGVGARRLASLSGGEKQRVAIASVMALEPEVLLLDEPTANLDPAGTREIVAVLARLRDAGRTVVLVEHKLDCLMHLVDHVVVLSGGGELSLQGTPAEVMPALLADPVRFSSVHVPQLARIGQAVGSAGSPVALTVADAARAVCARLRRGAPRGASATASAGRPKRDGVPPLSARGVCVSLGGRDILRDIDLDILPGECIAVVGANGAGKSTLVKALLGLVPLRAGEIQFFGRDLRGMRRREVFARAGLVFQNPEHQIVSATVAGELAFSLRARGADEAQARVRADACLSDFGLLACRDRSPWLLSQGQKRRLSVASMLVAGQELLLLDEPTYGQDPETGGELLALMEKINAAGVTLLVVTHDMDLVASACTRVLALCGGRVVFDGAPRALFARPDLLELCRLAAPPPCEVSAAVARKFPGFPSCLTIEEMVSAIAAGGAA